ncbi:MAG: hypothetical protein ACREM9_00140 [Gemmatimonadales bacterium]
MNQPAARTLLVAILLSGCSESAGPSPGTFSARLTGARMASVAGFSNASSVFAEPGQQFTIRMFAPRGDTVRAIVIACPGDRPPGPGVHALDVSDAACTGRYSRVISSLEGGTRILEEAVASSGSVTIEVSEAEQTVGEFTFSGVLVVDTDSVGTLHVAGSFNSDVLP